MDLEIQVFVCICTASGIALFARLRYELRLGSVVLLGTLAASWLLLALYLHRDLVASTGRTIVFDGSDDAQKYYFWTRRYRHVSAADVPFFDVVQARTLNPGYFYLLAVAWTLSPDPMTLVRLLKFTLYALGVAAFAGFARDRSGGRAEVASVVGGFLLLTPGFYFNFRNLKDGLLLSLMFLLTPAVSKWLTHHDRGATRIVALTTWLMLLAIRSYLAAAVACGVALELAFARRTTLSRRLSLVALVLTAAAVGVYSGYLNAVEDAGARATASGSLPYRIVQAVLSPIPWNDELADWWRPFAAAYWMSLPAVGWLALRRGHEFLDWRFWCTAAVLSVLIWKVGDPARKRLALYPIYFSWLVDVHRELQDRLRSRPPPAEDSGVRCATSGA